MSIKEGMLLQLTHRERGPMTVMAERAFDPKTESAWPVTSVVREDMMGLPFYTPGPRVSIASSDVSSYTPHRERF